MKHTCGMASPRFATADPMTAESRASARQWRDRGRLDPEEWRGTPGVRAPKAGPCKACDKMADAFLREHDTDENVRYDVSDAILDRGHGWAVSLDDAAEIAGGLDPQRAYDTDRDAARAALRAVLNSEPTTAAGRSTRAALRAVLSQIRDAAPEESGGRVRPQTAREARQARQVMRDWAVPSRTRADMKAVLRVLDEKHGPAYLQAAREASEANRPDAQRGSHRWAVTREADRATYAGPVCQHGTPERPACVRLPLPTTGNAPRWTVAATGEADSPVVYTDAMTHHVDSDTGEHWTDHAVTPLPFLSREDALAVRSVADYGTAWRPDMSTREADGFAARGIGPGPVRRPSSRKRRRDGALGGPATISHR